MVVHFLVDVVHLIAMSISNGIVQNILPTTTLTRASISYDIYKLQALLRHLRFGAHYHNEQQFWSTVMMRAAALWHAVWCCIRVVFHLLRVIVKNNTCLPSMIATPLYVGTLFNCNEIKNSNLQNFTVRGRGEACVGSEITNSYPWRPWPFTFGSDVVQH